jgi:hypothetical protein
MAIAYQVHTNQGERKGSVVPFALLVKPGFTFFKEGIPAFGCVITLARDHPQFPFHCQSQPPTPDADPC